MKSLVLAGLLALGQASAATLLDLTRATGRTPTQVGALLPGWQAEQLRKDLPGGRPGSEWRYTNRQGYILEIVYEGQKADQFILMGTPIAALNPARDYRQVLALFGFKAVPRSTAVYGASQNWPNFRGFNQVAVTGSGNQINAVIVKKTPLK